MEEETKKYYNLVSTNKIFLDRTTNVGVLSAEDCFTYGATGPILRGSGVKWDLRKEQPYGIYDEFDFDIPVGDAEYGVVGDCWNRYIVRMREVTESMKIIRQAMDGIEEGPIMGKVPKIIKFKEDAEIYHRVEAPRGELGYHLFTQKGLKSPYRLKVKSPCFTHTQMLEHLGPGQLIADFVASIGSIDIVLGEVDR